MIATDGLWDVFPSAVSPQHPPVQLLWPRAVPLGVCDAAINQSVTLTCVALAPWAHRVDPTGPPSRPGVPGLTLITPTAVIVSPLRLDVAGGDGAGQQVHRARKGKGHVQACRLSRRSERASQGGHGEGEQGQYHGEFLACIKLCACILNNMAMRVLLPLEWCPLRQCGYSKALHTLVTITEVAARLRSTLYLQSPAALTDLTYVAPLLVGCKPVVALPVEALCNPVLHARLLFHSTPAQVICVDISLTSNLEAAPSLSRGESASMDETAWASTANETRQGPHKQQGMQGQQGMHEKQGQHGPQAALQTSAKEQRAAAAAGKAPLPSLPPPRRSNGSFGKCLILRSHKGGLSRREGRAGVARG